MKIDGHAHACGEYLNINSICKKMSKNNLDLVVLVPGELHSTKTYKLKDYASKDPQRDVILKMNKITKIIISLTQMRRVIAKGNEYVFQLKQSAPDKIKQFFWITKKQWSTIDKNFERMQFDGIKLHQCWESFKVDSSWFKEVSDWAEEKDIPFFIHLYSYKDVIALIDFIKNNKTTKIIMAHNFGVEFFINDKLKFFDKIYFDLSNSYFVSNVRINLALKHFGSTKLLMGSDTPYGMDSLEKTIYCIENLKIPDSEKENILGKNMKDILKY